MREADVRQVVEAVVKALAEKGLLKGGDCGCGGAGRPAVLGPLGKGVGSEGSGITTVGTAGKVFGSFQSYKAPASAFEDKDAEHTHGPDCPHCHSVGDLGAAEIQAIGADRVGVCHPTKNCSKVSGYVDHTLLKANATQEEVGKLCEEARAYCFASVCVNPSYVALSAKLLKGSGVKVCTVIGFPLGSTTPTVKAIEARDAIANGADEIDMVINVGALKSGNDAYVKDDIRAVREATRGKVLKVILETSLVSKEEKVRACRMSAEVGADFVKTSTGFSTGGATVEDIRLMRETVGPRMGVKASGGIRDAETAKAMISAGATRLGTSASVAIVTDAKPAGGPKGY